MWDNTGPSCAACGSAMVQPHDFVDRHGDIEQLCAGCYCDALHRGPALHAEPMAWLLLVAVVGFVLAVAL